MRSARSTRPTPVSARSLPARILAAVIILSGLPLTATPQTTGHAEPVGKFLGAKPTEYPAWFKDSFLDLEEDVQEARDSGKRVMLFFHQHGCPYCNVMVERNLAQKDIEEKVRSTSRSPPMLKAMTSKVCSGF